MDQNAEMPNQQAMPSKEEMEKRQKEVSDFYTQQIPFLQIQKEYETLIVDIQEIEFKRMMISTKMAQMMAPAPGEEDQQAPPTNLRPLKKS